MYVLRILRSNKMWLFQCYFVLNWHEVVFFYLINTEEISQELFPEKYQELWKSFFQDFVWTVYFGRRISAY